MIAAFIPARGGSKGIPRKNLIDLCGKPLVAWTIQQAMQSQLVSEVVVSSDCENIGAVATACGARWLRRPDAISGDEATTESAIAHYLCQCAEKPAIIVLLQPTSPIRQPDDIDNAIRVLQSSSADSLFSARHVEGFTWQCNGDAKPHYDFEHRRRRQELSNWTAEENGSIYVFTRQSFRLHGNRLGGRIATYQMHPLDSFQVDEWQDLDLVRQIAPLRLKGVRHANAA